MSSPGVVRALFLLGVCVVVESRLAKVNVALQGNAVWSRTTSEDVPRDVERVRAGGSYTGDRYVWPSIVEAAGRASQGVPIVRRDCLDPKAHAARTKEIRGAGTYDRLSSGRSHTRGR